MSSIIKISGPVVRAKNVQHSKVGDVVKVGNLGLLGEIIEIVKDESVIQVYEETDGLNIGEKVVNTRLPLSVELGPGLLTSVYDGVQRPLDVLKQKSGNFIGRGLTAPGIDREKKWDFKPKVKVGDVVSSGQVLGEVKETSLITHRVLVPHGVNGKVTKIFKGSHFVEDTIAVIGKEKVSMLQKWPVKSPRPYLKKTTSSEPLITGQRVYDAFFPTVKGGQCAIPGPFGCGKTVTQQAIAKWCDADIIVYVGCGERGNEMTEVLRDFPELKDPKSGKPLMDRTVLIANTSNMPVAAREASVYTGMAIAEYYRDQGYHVALMADSTSRWAEAMREISGRLEEMPGEEGYPAYLASRLAQFYERSGMVKTLAKKDASITVIGAVSPAGGDFSEPVTQNTLKIVKVFWALDAKLAAKRHYWAINWLRSYSLYTDITDKWFNINVGKNWSMYRENAMALLQKESSLLEIAQLVGKDAMPEKEQFILLVARILREDLLQQNAFDEVDKYCPLSKQYLLFEAVDTFHEEGLKAIEKGVPANKIERMKLIEHIGRLKYGPDEDVKKLIKVMKRGIQ